MMEQTRRWFLSLLLRLSSIALIGAVLYPIIRYLSPPEVPEAATNQVDAGKTNDPEFLDKQFKIIRFGKDPVIVIKVAEEDFRAFSAVCTHLSCIVNFRKDRRLIWCYCHNGIYDLNGKNIGGPPPRPLTPYTVVLDTSGGEPADVIVRRA